MKEWFTDAELAAYQLPSLPSDRSAIRKKAEREAWQSRPRQGRGGGRERHIDALPREARAALLLRQALDEAPAPQPTPAVAREALWERFERRPDKAKEAARRRLAAVDAVERLIAAGLPKLKAIASVAAAERAAGRDVSEPTLRRWLALAEQVARADRLAALTPQYRGREARAEIPPEAWDYFKAEFLRPERPTAAACYERPQRVARERGWPPAPSLRTFTRRLERELPRSALLLARHGPQALKRFGAPAQRRDRGVFHALQAVCGDGHVFDLRVE